eukprot:Colp12_sorted_trinity150504_noHs@25301
MASVLYSVVQRSIRTTRAPLLFTRMASTSSEMKVCKTIKDLRDLRRPWESVGFVPTMGCLHDGHLSLVRQAKAENKKVIASIFVNPSQFAPHEDFDAYPRPVDSDLEMLRKEGVDAVFLPTVREMYSGTSPNADDNNGTFVTVRGKSHMLEGSVRPHFFTGVATVVCKLLNIVQPDVMYLGQKTASSV